MLTSERIADGLWKYKALLSGCVMLQSTSILCSASRLNVLVFLLYTMWLSASLFCLILMMFRMLGDDNDKLLLLSLICWRHTQEDDLMPSCWTERPGIRFSCTFTDAMSICTSLNCLSINAIFVWIIMRS